MQQPIKGLPVYSCCHASKSDLGWEQLLTAVRNRSRLPADVREMVILRIAVLNRAPYEFDAHVPHAQNAGVSDQKIAAIRQATVAPMFSAQAQRVLQLTDTMTRGIEVPDALFASLTPYFDDPLMIDLLGTIASYNMVSRFLAAAHVGH